ncbi:uncharacterized protein EAF02_003575 [Botrytis sinoallii]|uniref:uncharacterized protein n=1 Tax=Botrytis sinoallii TaxID=1463999 RepID=UPI001902846A|nr:uncharacterized protein EAF02_003575 [Botrytis sinoallii]KAF7886928.1 hypothetical protein EAF02_003575 [Botrytis sinoallii]
MISINGKEDWMAHEQLKAEKFWVWLAARTYKLNLRKEISNVQDARFESYHYLLEQWLDVKELLRDGQPNLETTRGKILVEARGAMSKAVCLANAGDGYSDSLEFADKMLKLNGTSREAWLGKLLFEFSALALLDTSRHYLQPTASELKKGERQAPEALDKLDKERKEFLATISHNPSKSPSNWRYDLYVRIDDDLKNKTGKDRERRALKNQWGKANSDYKTLEKCLKLCYKLLPPSHTGRERSPEISQTHSPRGRSNEKRDSESDTAPSSRKPASSKPLSTPKRRPQDVTDGSSSKPTPPARNHSRYSRTTISVTPQFLRRLCL